MRRDVIVIGAGGNCRDIADAIAAGARTGDGDGLSCIGFVDDNPELSGKFVNGLPVLGPLGAVTQYSSANFVFGIGSYNNHQIRAQVLRRMELASDRFVSVVHPTAIVSPSASVAPGAIILAHVNIGSTSRIGSHAIILQQAVVSHDCAIDDYAIIASGVVLTSHVEIGVSAYIGAGALIRNRVRIGEGTLVGMGSVVLNSVAARVCIVGHPARVVIRADTSQQKGKDHDFR